ncbi:hypothetical protein ACMAVI_006269 [Burkholderia cenocepacia]|uniref:MoaF-related domain-containing protein n=1 Tax=Burkholderia cenocepacia TaxID=95486 RepID=UPI00158D79D3|nr:hypothetical protein [Burkholderia cenocepacia]MBR8380436.1 hypothetical protein [Burkholderia cenocepacia]MDS0850863.1 hypothetical protein [Burkholderia cenocepacia]
MSLDHFPVGQQMQVVYPVFTVYLTLHSTERMTFEIKEGPYASVETVDIEVSPLSHGSFAVSWKELNGAAVVNIQNHDLGLFHSFVALPDGNFWRMKGQMTITHPAALQESARRV